MLKIFSMKQLIKHLGLFDQIDRNDDVIDLYPHPAETKASFDDAIHDVSVKEPFR